MSEEKANNWCSPDKCLSLLLSNVELKGRLNTYRYFKKINCLSQGNNEYYAKNRLLLFDWEDTNCEKIMGTFLANQLYRIGIERMCQFEILTKDQLVEKGIKRSLANKMWKHTDLMKLRLGV